MMNHVALPYLRCPVCGSSFSAGAGAVSCARGHSFDVARQGYVNLSTGRASHVGDTAAMVAARDAFLSAGHYDVVSTALATAARAALPPQRGSALDGPDGPDGWGTPDGRDGPPLVVDAGTGTGRHLAAVLDASPQAVGLGLDVSKPALRRAARAHPRAGAACVDLWRPLPLADASAALVLNVFAPRNGAEFRRVLRPGGALLVITPAGDHLAELVGALGLLRVDPDKAERVAGSLGEEFVADRTSDHRRTLALAHDAVRTLVGMGPSAWHADADRLTAGIAALPVPVAVTAAVRLTVYRPR